MHRSLTAPLLWAALFAIVTPGPSAHAASRSATAGFEDGQFIPLPAVPQPLTREGPALVYDPVRQRMIVFGGYGDGATTFNPLNDLWTLSLGPHPTWSPLAAAGTPPSSRLGHSMVYDSLRDRLIVYGGSTGAATSALSDVWALDLSGTPTWTLLNTGGASPPRRVGHCAIYDPLRDRMIVFGGYDGANFHNDAWELDFAGDTPQWLLLPAAIPPGLTPRDFAGAVYDPKQDRLVTCGGNAFDAASSTAEAVDETWALNLSGSPAWTQLAVTGLGARLGPAAAYDPVRGRMLVFGGWASGTYLGDAHALDLAGSTSAWETLAQGLPGPPPRTFTTGAYDPGLDRFVVFAGADGQRYFNDVCALDLAGAGEWTVYGAPTARYGHTFSYDPNGRRGILFGGNTGSADLNETWVFDLVSQSWSMLLPSNTPPSPRSGHVAVVDEANHRLIVFGGSSSGHLGGDVWALSLGAAPAWTKLADMEAGGPPALYLASGAYDGGHHRLVVVGGQGTGAIHNEVWTLALDGAPAWTAWPPSGAAPDPRAAAGLAYDATHDTFLWFGGLGGTTEPLADTWQLTLSGAGTADWTQAIPLPRGIFGQAVSVDTGRRRIIALDGMSMLGDEDHVFALPLDLSTRWTELFPAGTPPGPRHLAGAFYDALGNRVVLFGGLAGPTPRGDTWFLNLPDIPTPVLTSLVDEAVEGARVHLSWWTPDGSGTGAVAERTADGASWTPLGTLVADASGLIVLDDIVPGDGRWGYRLRVGPAGTPTETTWLTAGASAVFALAGASPNPAVTTSSIGFSLRGSLPASLAVYDVRGRAVLTRDLSRLGPGAHTLALTRGELGGAGVYLLRLTEGGRSLTRKLALLP